MKVKVRKCKKCACSIKETGKPDVMLNSESTFSFRREYDSYINELEMMQIVDALYDRIHYPRVKNGPPRRFPDIKISEYREFLDL